MVRAAKKQQFMMWYDDNPKLSLTEKIEDAVEAYVKSKRWRERPNLVLVNELDLVEFQNVTVRTAANIRRNNFWVGYEDATILGPELQDKAA